MDQIFLTTSDPAFIAELHVRGLAEQGKEYSPEEVVNKWQSVKFRNFIVAEHKGFAAFQERDGVTCYLSDMYVDPKYRGHGLGRALLRAVKCGHQCVELHVDKENIAARSLYESEGFVVIKQQANEESKRVFMKYTATQKCGQPNAFGAGYL